MSVRNLQHLFKPESVAVIGASNRAHSVGAAVMRNLLAGGFMGPVMPVNPKHEAVAGVLAYPDVASLPLTPELAVVCTPAASVPGLIAELGARGTRAAVVLTAGLTHANASDGRSLQQAMLDAARPHLLRILGPNCLGLLVPGAGLNASFAHLNALPGQLALVHQSGALCTALLDWAQTKGVGFSHFVSIGDSADVDFGDALDYLGSDPAAHAILLYMESIRHPRKFMSAARAAARNKPVLVIKAGRVAEGARAAASHTGALAGGDAVYDAAFQRAGMLRVYDTDEMFDAVATLAHAGPARGERLAVLTNGGGPGVIATDTLILSGGRLAELSADTLARLDAALPETWSRGNPVDIIGDGGGARYTAALEALLDDSQVDAVLVLHAPTAVVSNLEVAEAVARIATAREVAPRLLASWLGGAGVQAARGRLSEAGIANYDTPEGAVRGFMHRVRYRRNQVLLMETPPAAPDSFEAATEAARLIIDRALAEEREVLTEPEAKAILSAYGIPVVETRIVPSPEAAADAAAAMGLPVALKVLSDDISHKSDVGGVVLDLETIDDVRIAAERMRDRIARLRPDAVLQGFTVQRMARRSRAIELIVGASCDPVFGPVLLFGEGGTAVEVIEDSAVALPPLNVKLARELIGRTRVWRRLRGYRDREAVDLEALTRVLLRVSQLVVDCAEVVELDVNPLLADADGVLALDARMHVRRASGRGADRLAIRPYPDHLEEHLTLDGHRLLLRPIRPEDEPAHKLFLDALSPQDVRFRFFGQVREFVHSQIARFTQIDYDREMAFIATETHEHEQRTLGVVRAVTEPDGQRAEFAIVVSAAVKGKGLGQRLLEKMIRYCRERGVQELAGEVLVENEAMLRLVRRLGFKVQRQSGGGVMSVTLDLTGAGSASAAAPHHQ
jgi:acetyltransferase